MEVKVAQNFVLSFLYNKLPRRRVNLFGEELEKALLDKFQDHWYPDKPFKGSAFRCLRITDPNDPVLNRAARESGNPVSDIIENLPADLAIWIDPGEVSYRIGEKGSVKILYSENDSNILVGGGSSCSNSAGSGSGYGGISPGLQTSSSTSSGASDDLNAEIAGYLPLENLNVAMNALSCNPNSSVAAPGPPSLSSPPGQPGPPPSLSQGVPGSGSMNLNNGAGGHGLHKGAPPGLGSNGPSSLGGNSTGSGSCFTPFQPRAHHPPVTYTAGTFAQTKFGSTKLKTNGKKTNRMSPTEFSNYIKQRALQKQNSGGSQFGVGPMRLPATGSGGSGNSGFRPLSNSSSNGNLIGSNPPGFHSQHGFGGGGGGSSSSGFSQLNRSSNPWPNVDSDTEAILQDILSVGLSSKPSPFSRGSSGFFSELNGTSDFGSSGLAGNLFSDRFPHMNDDSGKSLLGESLSSNRSGNTSNNSTNEKYHQRVLVAN
eukprot:snap_masked-scaffold995_size72343-processed-gene-0.4 protein:Tk07626 transcript:snap_masked-scaffold995_size72343-processed-gene-0.4-mRNA-1 annotation:"GH12169"